MMLEIGSAVREPSTRAPQDSENRRAFATPAPRREPAGDGKRRLEHVLDPVPSRLTVSTLTPALNEERHIRDTVAALQAQDVTGTAEFIFIDGRSTDRTRTILLELAREDERIQVLDNPRGHIPAALNIGLRAATGEYVARIDAHTRYPAHYLRTAIERLQRGDVDWVAGPQIPMGTDTWSRRVAIALGTRLATGGSNRWQRDVAEHRGDEVELRTGVFTGVWRRATLDRAGGWDEGWLINEDSEMAARLLRQGARIVSLPALGAEYAPRNSLRALAGQYRRYGMYRAKTTLHHPWTVRPPHVILPCVVAAIVGSVVAPGRGRPAARALLGIYGARIAVEGARAADDRRDALAVSLVFAIMHVSWGAGFLEGLVRFARPSTRRPELAADLVGRAPET